MLLPPAIQRLLWDYYGLLNIDYCHGHYMGNEAHVLV